MADAELLAVLDYILNRCDEKAIDAVAGAVVRRRRDLALAGGAANLPDPRRLAKELSGRVNAAATLDGLRNMVLDMALRIIKQHAPGISNAEASALAAAWIPGGGGGAESGLPPAVLLDMVGQFVRFSTGAMRQDEDSRLRQEMEAWPERYWKAFPEVMKRIIKNHLDGATSGAEFRSALRTALALKS
jgi:hypothetical protein